MLANVDAWADAAGGWGPTGIHLAVGSYSAMLHTKSTSQFSFEYTCIDIIMVICVHWQPWL